MDVHETVEDATGVSGGRQEEEEEEGDDAQVRSTRRRSRSRSPSAETIAVGPVGASSPMPAAIRRPATSSSQPASADTAPSGTPQELSHQHMWDIVNRDLERRSRGEIAELPPDSRELWQYLFQVPSGKKSRGTDRGPSRGNGASSRGSRQKRRNSSATSSSPIPTTAGEAAAAGRPWCNYGRCKSRLGHTEAQCFVKARHVKNDSGSSGGGGGGSGGGAGRRRTQPSKRKATDSTAMEEEDEE